MSPTPHSGVGSLDHRLPETSALGDEFAGSPAATGRRLLALTIDVVAVLIVVTVVGLATGSLVLAATVLVELWIGLWVLQARTGLGLGNALLGLRVARADAPYSPGLGRAFVRAAITTGGALVFLVGAWIVEESSAWDASPKRRAWSDRAARTVVVAVPARGALVARPPARVVPAVVQQPPRPTPLRPTQGRPIPANPTQERWTPPPPVQHAPSPAPFPVPSPDLLVSNEEIGRNEDARAQDAPPSVESPRSSSGSIRSAAPAPNPEAPVTRSQRRRDAARTPATPIASRQTLPDELLLIVDTGERIQVAAGASVMLGRRPASDTDLTVTVTDPTVSKNHARLENRATGVWVTDLDSTNGTELVDEAGRAIGIAAHVPTRVEEGMRVRIGDRMFTVSRLIGTGA